VSLPKGWIETSLGALCSKPQYGYTTKASNEGDVKFLRTTDVTKPVLNWEKVPYCLVNPSSVDKYLLENGDIVISRAGSVGYSCRLENIPVDTVFASYLIRFKPNKLIDGAFIKHFLNAPEYWQQITDVSAGIAVQNINAKKLEVIKLPLPPLNEQKRIAKKLDELLTTVESIKTRLDNAPTIIKRFRQSILAAATSGKLTEEWRKENGVSEHWEKLTIDDVVHVKGGKRLPKGESLVFEDTGYPYIKAGQLKNGTVNPKKQEYLTKEVQEKISRYIVNAGDVYITIVGACIGDAGLIPKEFDKANLTENAVKLCEFKKDIENIFLSLWMRSYYIQNEIQSEIKSGAQGKLAIKRIKTLPFNLPTRAEQKEIVSQVESLFALADTLEEKIKAAKKRVDKLTQSILAKAFKGELVPQEPNDEPAEELLERIKSLA